MALRAPARWRLLTFAKAGVHLATNGVNIMMRKIAMALAAVAVVTAGSTLSASAMHGGGGGHGGGFGGGHGGGFGGGHFGGFGHPGMAGPAFHSNHFVGNRFGFRDRDRFFDHRFAFRDRDRFFHHRFFRNRFAFFGGGYPYGYANGCYTRVWTPWGWRWRY